MKILLVYSSQEFVDIIQLYLRQFNLEIAVVNSVEEGLGRVENEYFPLIISDWVMPGIDGLSFCEAIRDMPGYPRAYVILVTQLREPEYMAMAINRGVDDFISWPLDKEIFRLRVRVALRVLQTGQELTQRNHELNNMLSILRSNVDAATKLHLDTLPVPQKFGKIEMDWFFEPCERIGGDTFDYWPISEESVFFYQIDVSGHGLSSSLVAFSLNNYLNPTFLRRTADGLPISVNNPDILLNIAERLNQRYFEWKTNHYFTFLCGFADTQQKKIVFIQAGHTLPVLLRVSGEIVSIESKGFPLGLLEDVKYTKFYEQSWEEGDQLLIYSDGLMDLQDQRENILGKNQLFEMIASCVEDSPGSCGISPQHLHKRLMQWSGGTSPSDDMALLSCQFKT